MRLLVISLLGCLCLMNAHAQQIVAWKVRFQEIVEGATSPEELKAIETPPEKSVFFNKGDKLRAFSKEEMEQYLLTDPALEWAVWNETTGRLVTKSDWNGFVQLHMHFPMRWPMQIRTTLSCHAVKDASKPPAMDEKPIMRFSVLSRSGEKAQLNWQQGDASLNFEFESTMSEDSQIVNTRVAGSAQHTKDSHTLINTALTTHSSKAQWIARDYDGKNGLDLVIHNQVEFIDGTPAEEAIQVQRDGRVECINTSKRHHYRTEKISDTHWLMKMNLASSEVYAFLGAELPQENQVNPFDPVPPGGVNRRKPAPKLIRLHEVDAPDALKKWMPKPVLDLSSGIRKIGIEVGKGDFVGYDPRMQILFFYTDKNKEIDKMEMLFSPGLYCGMPSLVFVTWELQGQTCLIGRSGEKCLIARMSQDGPSLRSFEMEPMVSENREWVNLRIEAEENSTPGQAVMVKGAHTLVLGKWKTVAENHTTKGKRQARVKVELIEWDHE